LYGLQELELSTYPRMGRKSAQNLVAAIDRSRRPALSRLLYALGIRHVGETTARDVARHFGSIEAIMDASEEDLLRVPDRSEEHTAELQSREKLVCRRLLA